MSLHYLPRSSLHRLAGLPCRIFLSLWSPSRDTQGPSVVFEAVDMPCPGPFHFSHIADRCPLPDPDVGLSILACHAEHTSFHFGLCGRKFVLCLFGQCPVHHYVIAGSIQELYTCLFKQMARLLLKISRSHYGYKLYCYIFRCGHIIRCAPLITQYLA